MLIKPFICCALAAPAAQSGQGGGTSQLPDKLSSITSDLAVSSSAAP
jgi:hypothetical protein